MLFLKKNKKTEKFEESNKRRHTDSPQNNINIPNRSSQDKKIFRLPTRPPKVDYNKFKHRMRKEDLERLTIKNTLLTDITPLLIYTQKVAASKLDMSESMLCKKFKETINKKWPYRQIRKIEKEIAVAENKDDLDKLILLRNEHMAPVKIYVRRYLYQEEVDDENFTFDQNINEEF